MQSALGLPAMKQPSTVHIENDHHNYYSTMDVSSDRMIDGIVTASPPGWVFFLPSLLAAARPLRSFMHKGAGQGVWFLRSVIWWTGGSVLISIAWEEDSRRFHPRSAQARGWEPQLSPPEMNQ